MFKLNSPQLYKIFEPLANCNDFASEMKIDHNKTHIKACITHKSSFNYTLTTWIK